MTLKMSINTRHHLAILKLFTIVLLATCGYAFESLWHQKCLKAKCDVIFPPKCPADSKILLAERPSLTECCKKPEKCVCNKQFCQDKRPICPRDHEITVVRMGSEVPGDCCDLFHCMPPPLDCSHSFCPSPILADCPPDSFRPNDTNLTLNKSERKCCPVTEPCICKPDSCKPLMCPEGYHVEISKKGTGAPGLCCDNFECISVVFKKIACEHKGALYEDGGSWRPDPCSECDCKGGLIFCKKYECPDTNWCSHVKKPDNECCPVCIGCKSENGEFHNFTEQWQKDECTTCSCGSDGSILCHEQMCTVECDTPIKVPGRCCPVCEKPTIVQIPYVCPSIELCPLMCEYGMKKDLQGCFICECQESDWTHFAAKNNVKIFSTPGSTSTVTPFLASFQCSKFDEKSCPRKCINGYEKDARGCLICKCKTCPVVHTCYKSCLYGFEINSNGCPICKCTGTAQFTNLSSLVNFRPKNKVCRTSNSVRDQGEWWFDGCRYCFCDFGREFCSILSCPPAIGCENPKFDENGCCLVCPGANQIGMQSRLVCHSPGDGRNFVEGEFWSLGQCTQCTCHIGHVLCHRKTCGPAPCHNPKKLPDRCCPVCENADNLNGTSPSPVPVNVHCTLGGESYSSGSQWKVGACKSCRCSDGAINCFEENCVEQCAQGHQQIMTIKNACCPLCTVHHMNKGLCRYKDATYNVDEHWKDGSCRNCTCKGNSDVLCTQFECPKCPNGTNFSVPLPVPGQCCPACPNPNRRFLHTLGDDHVPILRANENSTSTPSNLMPMLVLGAFSVLALVLLLALFISWYKKRSANRRRRTISEISSSVSSTRSFSDPLLSAVICGRGCPKNRSRRPSPLVGKVSASFDVGSPTSAEKYKNGKNGKHDKNNNQRSDEKRRSLLTPSPYDSDGASTALTYEGGTSS